MTERSLDRISPRTLSLRLRALEQHGIVERHTYPEVPPRVEYALTEKGRALVPLIEDMRNYGRRWLFGAPQSGDGRSRAAVLSSESPPPSWRASVSAVPAIPLAREDAILTREPLSACVTWW